MGNRIEARQWIVARHLSCYNPLSCFTPFCGVKHDKIKFHEFFCVCIFFLSPPSLSFSLTLSFSPVSPFLSPLYLSLPPLSLYLSFSLPLLSLSIFLSHPCLSLSLSLSHFPIPISLPPIPVVSLSFSHSCLPFIFLSPCLSLSLSQCLPIFLYPTMPLFLYGSLSLSLSLSILPSISLCLFYYFYFLFYFYLSRFLSHHGATCVEVPPPC